MGVRDDLRDLGFRIADDRRRRAGCEAIAITNGATMSPSSTASTTSQAKNSSNEPNS
jgi:hypothetical protein